MSEQWTLPPDPVKPNCPYMPGFQAQLTTHNPPPPFGGSLYDRGTRPSITDEWIYQVTQSEHVLAYPPLETASPSNPQCAKLTITKSISIGNARGAQLVACTIELQDGNTFLATAKIFDSLYYPFQHELVDAPIDATWNAERTTAAKLPHTSIFTLLPISHAGRIVERPVRLLLIEYLDGSSIRGLYARNGPTCNDEPNGFHYAKEYRLQILALIMDGTVKQTHIGLNQGDLAARNVMLVPRPSAPGLNHLPRVDLIDYNNSDVYENTKYGRHLCQDAALPCNPIDWYWKDSLPEFGGWIPVEWYQDHRLRQEWLVRRFGGDKISLYAPLTTKLIFKEEECTMDG